LAGSREEYEAATKALLELANTLRASGNNAETIARILVEQRNALKSKFREGMPLMILERIEARNMAKYGHPVGPHPEALLQKYGSWDEVIAAAARPANLNRE
jgi:hypothetical protein